MANVLIRDIPDDVLATIDAQAKRLGLSRTAYLRRTLERERFHASQPVTLDDLTGLATRAADLDDPDVMADAWS